MKDTESSSFIKLGSLGYIGMWHTIWKMKIDTFLYWIALTIHSPEMAMHTWGMMNSPIAKTFIKSLNLNKKDVRELEYAIFMHDIGKLKVPRKILKKRGRLTIDEYRKIKRHADVGADIVYKLCKNRVIERAIREHHERIDGSGYPKGLKEDEISYYAKVIALLDVFDVMSRGRQYQEKSEIKSIINEIEQGSGVKYDPVLSRLVCGIILSEHTYSKNAFSANRTTSELLFVSIFAVMVFALLGLLFLFI